MARVRALIDGIWHAALAPGDPRVTRLRAQPTTYRDWITREGKPGPMGQPARPAEFGRYHLYVSYACPWAHRAILYRRLKGLKDAISMSVVQPRMAGAQSWTFGGSPHGTPDHLYHSEYLHELYTRGDPKATTVVTVPMLWDRAKETIVNRESADIIRILEDAFDTWGDACVRFRPEGFEADVERMNSFVLQRVCTAVYRVGFAANQATYDRELRALFAALDTLEQRLQHRLYLLGDTITECDWHLFATLVRFDVAYGTALRCSRYRLADYPALSDHTQRIYELPGVAETVDFEAIRLHYFDDHPEIRQEIVPSPPGVDAGGQQRLYEVERKE